MSSPLDFFEPLLKDKKYDPPKNLARVVIAHPVHWIAFGFGSGLLPIAPGTWASLFTAILFWFVPPIPMPYFLALISLLFVFGVWICGESSRRLGAHDFQGIVFDEVVGMLATLAFVSHEPMWIAVALVNFRIADIWKPWPIRDIDHRLHGGLGIMLDDVLAAFYAGLATLLMQQIFITVI